MSCVCLSVHSVVTIYDIHTAGKVFCEHSNDAFRQFVPVYVHVHYKYYLLRMKKFGIPCPQVQLLRKHILVMSFIGKDGKPAPKLRDALLDSADLEIAYAQMEDVSLISNNYVHV